MFNFKEHKEERALKKNKDVAELIKWQEIALKEIDKKLAAAEAIEDSADKILELQQLIADISNENRAASNKQDNIAAQRGKKRTIKSMSVGGTVGMASLTVPAVMFAPVFIPLAVSLGLWGLMPGFLASSTGMTHNKKLKQLIKQNPILSYFGNMLAAQKNRALEALDVTIKNCDLEKLPLSPGFETVMHSCPALRERFAKATASAAKKALEEKAALEQESKPAAKQIFDPHKYKNIRI